MDIEFIIILIMFAMQRRSSCKSTVMFIAGTGNFLLGSPHTGLGVSCKRNGTPTSIIFPLGFMGFKKDPFITVSSESKSESGCGLTRKEPKIGALGVYNVDDMMF